MIDPRPTRSIIPRALDEVRDRLEGPFAAQVVDNGDPQKQGRLLLSVPEVLGPGAVHPTWALPAAGPLGGGETGGVAWGSAFIPDAGAWVRVMFVAGDVSVPIWLPGWTKTLPTMLATHYPKRRGLVTPSGHAIVFDDSDGTDGDAWIAHRGGAAVTLREGAPSRVDAAPGRPLDLQGAQAGGSLAGVARLGDTVKALTVLTKWAQQVEAGIAAAGGTPPSPLFATFASAIAEIATASSHTRSK